MWSDIHVELLDVMGSDLDVVNAARVSFAKESDWKDSTPCGVEELHERDGKLIKYLADHNHWSPFSHCFLKFRIKAPIFVARQLQKHCLTGDTVVSFCKPVKGKSNGMAYSTLDHLYKAWSGQVKYQGGAKGRLNVTKRKVKVYDESTGEFTSSKITDVFYQGIKPVYKVTTSSGQYIKATACHKVLTNRGWVKVGDLTDSDLMVSQESGEVIRGRTRRDLDSADVIARREHQKNYCRNCGSTEDLECDHIVPVKFGGTHDRGNLQTLCSTCHAQKSASERGEARSTMPPRYVNVVSVEYAGEERVYDISVDTHHNFLANGLVVHNCVGLAWNEVSRRYVDYVPEFYRPGTWRERAANKKQGSGSGTIVLEGNNLYGGDGVDYDCDIYEFSIRTALDAYNELLRNNVAPEQARMVLPQSTITEWIWSGSLFAFGRVCNLRLSSDAQREAGMVAQCIYGAMAERFPVSTSCLVKSEGGY